MTRMRWVLPFPGAGLDLVHWCTDAAVLLSSSNVTMSYVIDTVLPFCLYVALLSVCMPATDRVQAALAGDQTPEEVFSYDLSGVPIIFAPEKRSSDLDMKVSVWGVMSVVYWRAQWR